jgi:hypothetical protein
VDANKKNEILHLEIRRINKTHAKELGELKQILLHLKQQMTEEEKQKLIDDYLDKNLDRILREIGGEMEANAQL